MEEKRRKKREEKWAKNQAPFVGKTPEEDAVHIEIHAKESNEDGKTVASKRIQQLIIPNESYRQSIQDEVSVSKRKKVETINEGERARPDGFISKNKLSVKSRPWTLVLLPGGRNCFHWQS